MIEICVEKNRARLKPIHTINSGCIGIVGVKFSFSRGWAGLKKTAIVFVDEYDEASAFKYILKDDNTIPPEDMPKELFEKKADLYIGVFGDNEKGQRVVTNTVSVCIKEGTPTEGANMEVTPDLYNQIMGALMELAQTASDLQTRADNGGFNGRDGVDGIDGKDGTDYVLTDEDKDEITKAIESLLKYVPPERMVAGLQLSGDITISQLIDQLTNTSEGAPKMGAYVANAIKQNPTILEKADKTYVNEAVGAISTLDIKKVDALPAADISTTTIYLVPADTVSDDNTHEEYIYVDGNWEHIGSTNVDLSGYVQNTRTIAGLTLGQDISAETLIDTLYNVQLFAARVAQAVLDMYDVAIKNTIEQTISRHTDVLGNTSARHRHRNEQVLDRIKEVPLSDTWELILDKTLPAQSTDGVILDWGEVELSGEYRELRIMTVMWTSAVGNATLYINDDDSESAIKLLGLLSTNASYTYDFILKNDIWTSRYLQLDAERIMTGVNATNSGVSKYRNWSSNETVPDMESVITLKLELSTGWSNSTERYVRVYGRR